MQQWRSNTAAIGVATGLLTSSMTIAQEPVNPDRLAADISSTPVAVGHPNLKFRSTFSVDRPVLSTAVVEVNKTELDLAAVPKQLAQLKDLRSDERKALSERPFAPANASELDRVPHEESGAAEKPGRKSADGPLSSGPKGLAPQEKKGAKGKPSPKHSRSADPSAALKARSTAGKADDNDDGRKGKGGSAGAGRPGKEEGIETENLFGFTEGSDTGEAGEREILYGVLGRKRQKANKYTAVQNDLSFEYSPRDDLKVGFSALMDAYRSSKKPLLDEDDPTENTATRRSIVTGLSAEAKFNILKRGQSPIGLSVSFQPEFRHVAAGRGAGPDLIQFETKLMVDAAIVPDRLFIALNGAWEPQVTWSPIGEVVRDTNLTFSGAISAQVVKDVFLGGEARYLGSFANLSFQHPPDYGVFIGPTLYAALSDKAHISAAYSMRVGGGVTSKPEPVPDFGNVPDALERHHMRVRFRYAF